MLRGITFVNLSFDFCQDLHTDPYLDPYLDPIRAERRKAVIARTAYS